MNIFKIKPAVLPYKSLSQSCSCEFCKVCIRPFKIAFSFFSIQTPGGCSTGNIRPEFLYGLFHVEQMFCRKREMHMFHVEHFAEKAF